MRLLTVQGEEKRRNAWMSGIAVIFIGARYIAKVHYKVLAVLQISAGHGPWLWDRLYMLHLHHTTPHRPSLSHHIYIIGR